MKLEEGEIMEEANELAAKKESVGEGLVAEKDEKKPSDLPHAGRLRRDGGRRAGMPVSFVMTCYLCLSYSFWVHLS